MFLECRTVVCGVHLLRSRPTPEFPPLHPNWTGVGIFHLLSKVGLGRFVYNETGGGGGEGESTV